MARDVATAAADLYKTDVKKIEGDDRFGGAPLDEIENDQEAR